MDAHVIVAALRRSEGASAALPRAVRRNRAEMLLSVPLLMEYEATCHVAEHRLVSRLSESEIETFFDGLVFLAEPVETHCRWRPQLRDPGDEMVLETAVNGQARAIVTFNRRDYGEAPQRFGIDVLSPGEALRRTRE